VLARAESATVRELVAYTLRRSDNNLAEVLGRMAATAEGQAGSFEGCAATVKRVLAELAIPTANLVINDCSGLNRNSKITAATLTSLLTKSAGTGAGALGDVARLNPVGGLQDTLSRRFVTGPGAGNVRAKTGTLTGVRALAGIVQTSGGRELVFAVILNPDETVSGEAARASIDAFVTGLAGLG
jgi:D-alanyl-D-alanine carboxypeptidase/D-alanyl-D-alanine-endopeptidase (penicillin-binding protein 4)